MTDRLTEAELAELERLIAAHDATALMEIAKVAPRLIAAARLANELDEAAAEATASKRNLGIELRLANEQLAERDATIALIADWTHQFGEDLVPHGPDTYGEGKRDAKATVSAILSKGGDAVEGRDHTRSSDNVERGGTAHPEAALAATTQPCVVCRAPRTAGAMGWPDLLCTQCYDEFCAWRTANGDKS